MQRSLLFALTAALSALGVGLALFHAWGTSYFWLVVVIGAIAVIVGWLFAGRTPNA